METITELFTTSKLSENEQHPSPPFPCHQFLIITWVEMCALTFTFILCVYAGQERKRLWETATLGIGSYFLYIVGISEICMCERDVFMWVVNAKVSALSFGCKQSAECLYADVFFMLYFSGVGLLHID